MYKRLPYRQWVIYRAPFQVHAVGKRLKPVLSRQERRQDDERYIMKVGKKYSFMITNPY